jgi:hypothetical protein
MRRGAYQLLAYMYGAGESLGFLILARPGMPKVLPVELLSHIDRMEEFLNKAEAAFAHREQGTLPDFTQDVEECKRCQFYGSVCNPPLLSGKGAMVLMDPELEHMLERRTELYEVAHEYDRLDAKLKERFHGMELAVAGKFLIQGKWGKHTYYEYPEEVMKKYVKTDPKGRFVLSITKIE